MHVHSLSLPKTVRGEEPHPTGGDSVAQNTADLKEKTLKNNPQSYSVSAVPMG
jgi:hypothetical protein